MAERGAQISECGAYRYRLWRRWGAQPLCVFIMLNPSTADADTDDPTIRRCISFAKRESCGGLMVVNLYAFRATYPRELERRLMICGPENNRVIRETAEDAEGPIVAAWGAHRMTIGRDEQVKEIVAKTGRSLWCLGKTASGAPRHPLYVRADQPLSWFCGLAPTDPTGRSEGRG